MLIKSIELKNKKEAGENLLKEYPIFNT